VASRLVSGWKGDHPFSILKRRFRQTPESELAKAETLLDRPAYRNAFLKRRCVVPAESFYEWVGPKKERQPLSITRTDGKRLSMAGLYNCWKPALSKGRPILTFTIVTTAPSLWMAIIHNRMWFSRTIRSTPGLILACQTKPT
jgi:putative SOS response-associated peptidase YedK